MLSRQLILKFHNYNPNTTCLIREINRVSTILEKSLDGTEYFLSFRGIYPTILQKDSAKSLRWDWFLGDITFVDGPDEKFNPCELNEIGEYLVIGFEEQYRTKVTYEINH